MRVAEVCDGGIRLVFHTMLHKAGGRQQKSNTSCYDAVWCEASGEKEAVPDVVRQCLIGSGAPRLEHLRLTKRGGELCHPGIAGHAAPHACSLEASAYSLPDGGL